MAQNDRFTPGGAAAALDRALRLLAEVDDGLAGYVATQMPGIYVAPVTLAVRVLRSAAGEVNGVWRLLDREASRRR